MYEYKVIPAPQRTVKVKGLKTPGERFAHLLAEAMNAEAEEGWEFLRAETLPCEERKGLTGTAKSFQSVLIFRRALGFAEEGHADWTDDEAGLANSDHAEADTAWRDHDQPDTDRPEPSAGATGATVEQPPRLSLVATRHEPETRVPLAGQKADQLVNQSGRQEPVLRPGAAATALASERPEPVLRTRARDEGENNG